MEVQVCGPKGNAFLVVARPQKLSPVPQEIILMSGVQRVSVIRSDQQSSVPQKGERDRRCGDMLDRSAVEFVEYSCVHSGYVDSSGKDAVCVFLPRSSAQKTRAAIPC